MSTIPRSFLTVLAIFSLVIFATACGGSDAVDSAAADKAAASSPGSAKAGESRESGTTGGTLESPEAAMMMAKYREMAASEGIYFGEVPEGFPLDFVPLYPDGEIDKSSTGDGDFTLLQNVPADKDTVFAWYKEFYTGLGWSAGDPFTAMNRTMVGFAGSDGKVDMTMIDKDDGKTFVALVLSPK